MHVSVTVIVWEYYQENDVFIGPRKMSQLKLILSQNHSYLPQINELHCVVRHVCVQRQTWEGWTANESQFLEGEEASERQFLGQEALVFRYADIHTLKWVWLLQHIIQFAELSMEFSVFFKLCQRSESVWKFLLS